MGVVPGVESDWTEDDKIQTPAQTPDMKRKKIKSPQSSQIKSPLSSESEPESLKKRVKPSRLDVVVPGVESDWTEDDKVQPKQPAGQKKKKIKSPLSSIKSPMSSESEPESLKKRVKPSRVDHVVPGVESDWTEEDKAQQQQHFTQTQYEQQDLKKVEERLRKE